MGSSDFSANSSPLPLRLYSSMYEYAWTDVGAVNKIESLAQPVYDSASYMGSILYYIHDTSYSEMEVPLMGCGENSSQALSSSHGNCSQICFDSNTLYMPYNLQPCLSLGVAAMLIQSGSLVLDETEKNTETALKQYNVGNLSTWDGTSIVQNIIDCTVAACTENKIGECPSKMLSLDGLTVTADNLQTVYAGLGSFCTNIGTTVNSDIAGPGVMLSYLVQICAALLFWIIAKLLASWTRVITWPFLLCRQPPPPSFDSLLSPASHSQVPGRRKSAWLRATAIQRRLSRLRLHAATLTMLVEFQETQAFFVGAIQIATLATFKPTATTQSDSANTVTFGEAISDSQLVQTLCVNGTLPILLVQCLLQRYGMRWWYTFALVSANVILAFVVDARRNYLIADFDALWSVFVASNPVDACGGLANPQVYCDTLGTVYASISNGIYALYFTVPVLIIDFLAPSIMRLRNVDTALNTWRRTNRVFRFLEAKVWPLFLKTFWFFLEFALLLSLCFYSARLFIISLYMTEDGSLGTWGFGQLVAVMVWVPPLLKFVYLNIFGIEEGLGRRLAHDYRVVHDELPVGEGADAASGIVELDELQQGQGDWKENPYAPSDAGTLAQSLRMGSHENLIQSPPELYNPEYKRSWPPRWPKS
ncbi:hypothetical protein VP1G_01929 [Cytospora mali]|uniref:Uncharacterized protein n=1 Tax=Cytospora mali TaxID=578113 RepID=A0A194US94_CYTMA|nr:hypothetical protein VP1G_01929 [Valsa mali var. pyri (nom. inval.)]